MNFVDLGEVYGAERYARADRVVAVLGDPMNANLCTVWVDGVPHPFEVEDSPVAFVRRVQSLLLVEVEQ